MYPFQTLHYGPSTELTSSIPQVPCPARKIKTIASKPLGKRPRVRLFAADVKIETLHSFLRAFCMRYCGLNRNSISYKKTAQSLSNYGQISKSTIQRICTNIAGAVSAELSDFFASKNFTVPITQDQIDTFVSQV